ncbi:hypothetical protein [Micromonospora sp. NPDC005806]|uniref:hypothetical protein n=1 Tax=Micromonospora sp. NPDC005806 TaxID=3364234 RepID=UPI00369CC0F1
MGQPATSTGGATAEGYLRPQLLLWADGEEVNPIVVSSLVVEERVDRPSTLTLTIASAPVSGPDAGDGSASGGDWDTLLRDDAARALGLPGYRLLSRVTVGFALTPTAGGPTLSEVVFDGFVTALEHRFAEARVPDSELVLTGIDASCLLHVETVTKRWSGLADSEIVEQIYTRYGFDVAVETTPRRDELVSSLLQRGTDAEFLRMLARRNGFEVFVTPSGGPVQAGPNPGKGVVGTFRTPAVGGVRLPEAWLFPHDAPALVDLVARYDALQPTGVRSWHVDGRSRTIGHVEVGDPGHPRTGPRSRDAVVRERLERILGAGAAPAPVDVRTTDVPIDDTELATLARAELRAVDWFATADGTLNGARYPAVPRAGRTLPVTGAGPVLSGDWYVRGVTHRWGAHRALPGDPPVAETGAAAETADFVYETDVALARNALGGEP